MAGLFLGARVDGEADGTPNVKANGDDIGTDDEDGVVNPEADLRATAGTQPTIALRATNTTGTAATLSGWIDSNGDGVFDNATERAQLAVPTGTNNGLFTLTLPTVPVGFFGKTYARFRLSTDAAGGSATGLASDGEVEDYDFNIFASIKGDVQAGLDTPFGNALNGGPTLRRRTVLGDHSRVSETWTVMASPTWPSARRRMMTEATVQVRSTFSSRTRTGRQDHTSKSPTA